ncbi:MAG: RNA-binding transcriptional accessory protein [Methanobrevibacter sp.]|jgi:uncharacterized protein|nr:RNA-binding transcriptional accessory protein [Candidatus Methanovirga meridionalis]
MIIETLSKELNIKKWQSEVAISLIEQGNTIPFISRYRKEITGSLDDETLRKFSERLNYLRNLEEKKKQVLLSISEQGKLSPEIKKDIEESKTLVRVDDIYRPFRPKRRTRATIAKEKGLEGLAQTMLSQEIEDDLEKIAKKYLSKELNVNTVQEAIEGAQDILAEIISENPDFRESIRRYTYFNSNIEVKAKDENVSSQYEMYYSYVEKISQIKNHRILAINRGVKEKILKSKIVPPIDKIITYLNQRVLIDKSKNKKNGNKKNENKKNENSLKTGVNTVLNSKNSNNNSITNEFNNKEYNPFTKNYITKSVLDSYKRLIAPSIEREIMSHLIEKAEDKSIEVFSVNLEALLLESPILNKVVLGWDPGFRTGCKIAVINEFGEVLKTTVVFPTEPNNKVLETKKIVLDLIKEFNIDIIALGNGTASRESEQIIVDIIKGTDVKYAIVNEAGASVYSASKLATFEFPDFDVGERSAISIARRLQDPLAELVKIDPKSIGVGQYQHDMNQKKLNNSLKSVVEKVVNNVGVDLNTASFSLLTYVSGLNEGLAKNIVKYRLENGVFTNRADLLNVNKLGSKTYEQCVGFLKVYNSDNSLDITTIHPESYNVTKKLLKKLEININDIGSNNLSFDEINFEKLSAELDVGEITLKDIVNELKKPGRDPREEMHQPILRNDTLSIEDLEEGMILQGTVRNVVDFGAFVDIGVHQDGLVHISQLVENKFVKHPLDIVNVEDIVNVKVLDVDSEKKRIQLSMII